MLKVPLYYSMYPLILFVIWFPNHEGKWLIPQHDICDRPPCHEHTIQDGRCVDMKNFSLYFCPIANRTN